MINVSNEFKETMQERRNFKNYAEIAFQDGTELILGSSQFTVGNNSLIDGVGTETFPLGAAVQKCVQLEILNDQEQYANKNFFGAKIRLYLDFQLSETTERIEKGAYTVITPETYGETIIITAYDDMYKADKDYTTKLTYPQTAGAVLRDICDTCDIVLGSTTFPHDDFLITNQPTGKFRDVIGYIAMIACGNARVDVKNKLKIMSYDFSSFENVPVLSEFTSPKIEYNDTVITGFKTITIVETTTTPEEDGEPETVEEEKEILVGTDTYVITVENPLIAGQEETVLTWLLETIGNIPFRPFSGDAVFNPLVEFMDLVKVQDRRRNQYNSFITDVNFLMPGYTTLKNAAPSMARNALTYSSDASRVEQSTKKLIEREKTARELAIEELSKALGDGSGMYSTDVSQPDGSKIRYLHDKPTLGESKNVIKITSDAIGFSTDGGDSYPYGITLDGDTITNILQANGINADWINAGSILVKDDEGNIILSVDAETGKLIANDGEFSGTIVSSTLKAPELIFYDDYDPELEVGRFQNMGTAIELSTDAGVGITLHSSREIEIGSGPVEINGPLYANKSLSVSEGLSVNGEVKIGSGNAHIFSDGGQRLYLCGSTEGNYYARLGVMDNMWTFCPQVNNFLQMGSPSHRWGTVYSNNALNVSDRKEKQDIVPLNNCAAKLIMALKPVTFKYIPIGQTGTGQRIHMGLIAQDASEAAMSTIGDMAFYQAACFDTDGNVIDYDADIPDEQKIWSINYSELIAPLIKTIQIHQNRLDSLEQRLQKLENEKEA